MQTRSLSLVLFLIVLAWRSGPTAATVESATYTLYTTRVARQDDDGRGFILEQEHVLFSLIFDEDVTLYDASVSGNTSLTRLTWDKPDNGISVILGRIMDAKPLVLVCGDFLRTLDLRKAEVLPPVPLGSLEAMYVNDVCEVDHCSNRILNLLVMRQTSTTYMADGQSGEVTTSFDPLFEDPSSCELVFSPTADARLMSGGDYLVQYDGGFTKREFPMCNFQEFVRASRNFMHFSVHQLANANKPLAVVENRPILAIQVSDAWQSCARVGERAARVREVDASNPQCQFDEPSLF